MRYGYFDNDNREYVIERPDTPVSWTNYLGLEEMCTVISHNAGGYCFYRSAERGRITRFRPNGVPLDRPGHYVYLRDDETGEYWSVSWQPVGKDLTKAKYECRHGLSYSKFRCRYRGIEAEQKLFIPLGDNVEIWDVRIQNKTKRRRKLSVFSYLEFSLHEVELDNLNFQYGLYAGGSSYKNGIIDFEFVYTPVVHHFFTANFEPDSYDCLRDEYIGVYHTETDPVAVVRGRCANSAQRGGNHCGALHKQFTLKPGEEIRPIFMLGVGSREKAGRRIRKKYSQPDKVEHSWRALREHWDKKLSVYQCRTPDSGLTTMVNIWNLYQAETCVTWSRFASFIEVGGRTGLGYRDTAQDVMSVVHTNPTKARERICELLTGQLAAGYGLHLFDPLLLKPGQVKSVPLSEVCSDDVLWLVVTVCEYVKETGDTAFLSKVLPFADKGKATVYEHLGRALDFSAEQVGKSGICKGLMADWNDCLNLGGGESSMVSFQHYWALQAFTEAARFLGRKKDVRKYELIAEKVQQACDRKLWDGKWYLRGFTAKGKKIGTQKDREGKLFLNAQSWAVLSGVARGDRAIKCMDAVKKHLYSKYGLHLLWPAYGKADEDIGLVTKVYKGVKENAAIFSHPNPWAVMAECMLGRGDRAFQFYNATVPYRQNDIIETREAEPYSYCQFVMGKDHVRHGQARHPWLTGTAGWFYTAVTRWMLGVRPGFEEMVIDPCIPREWKEFQVRRSWRGAVYEITVKNPRGRQKGVVSIMLNGKVVQGAIPVQKKGSVNKVEVTMG